MNFLCVNFSLCLLFSAIFFTTENAKNFAKSAELFRSFTMEFHLCGLH